MPPPSRGRPRAEDRQARPLLCDRQTQDRCRARLDQAGRRPHHRQPQGPRRVFRPSGAADDHQAAADRRQPQGPVRRFLHGPGIGAVRSGGRGSSRHLARSHLSTSPSFAAFSRPAGSSRATAARSNARNTAGRKPAARSSSRSARPFLNSPWEAPRPCGAFSFCVPPNFAAAFNSSLLAACFNLRAL